MGRHRLGRNALTGGSDDIVFDPRTQIFTWWAIARRANWLSLALKNRGKSFLFREGAISPARFLVAEQAVNYFRGGAGAVNPAKDIGPFLNPQGYIKKMFGKEFT